MHTWFHSRPRTRDGRFDVSKPLSNLKFGLERLEVGECHSGKDVAREQPQSELVRVVKDARLAGGQTQFRGDLFGRTYRAYDVRRLHLYPFSPAWCAPGRALAEANGR